MKNRSLLLLFLVASVANSARSFGEPQVEKINQYFGVNPSRSHLEVRASDDATKKSVIEAVSLALAVAGSMDTVDSKDPGNRGVAKDTVKVVLVDTPRLTSLDYRFVVDSSSKVPFAHVIEGDLRKASLSEWRNMRARANDIANSIPEKINLLQTELAALSGPQMKWRLNFSFSSNASNSAFLSSELPKYVKIARLLVDKLSPEAKANLTLACRHIGVVDDGIEVLPPDEETGVVSIILNVDKIASDLFYAKTQTEENLSVEFLEVLEHLAPKALKSGREPMSKEALQRFINHRIEKTRRNEVEFASPFIPWTIKGKDGQVIETRVIVSHSIDQLKKEVTDTKSAIGYVLYEHRVNGKIIRASAIPSPCRITQTRAGFGILTNHYEFTDLATGRTAAYVIGEMWIQHLNPHGRLANADRTERVGMVAAFHFGRDLPLEDYFSAAQGIIEPKYLPLTEVKDQKSQDLNNLEP